MKNIKKIGKAVAGSALLVGATLAGAASFAAAQSGSSGDHTLGDYPAPYVGEDGNVDASIVVGQSAKTVDVVGAVDIAGSLSQAAFTEESVSAGGGSFGWSATNGVTLDTRNDQLYFNDQLNTVRETLTEDQLDALAETTFRDDAGDETDVEYFLYPGNQQVQYGKPDDRNNKDPILYVENPSNPSTSDYLFRLQANFEESIAFNTSDVKDEEIDLFGKEFTVSTDTSGDELVLFGSQTEHDIATGESQTITVNDQEHTIEVVAVTSPDTVAFRVDGDLREENEDDKFDLDGQEVRITDVIQTNSQESEGVATFGLGSEELHLTNGQSIEDSEGDDIDGTFVRFNGDTTANDAVADLSSLELYVGSNDDDREYVMADESYSHPMFEDFQFHFGGLNPQAGEGTSDSVSEVKFSTSGDDTATASFTARGGDSATVEFAHTDPTSAFQALSDLADDDGDRIHTIEGQINPTTANGVAEDEYFTADAGDFAHLWEVTSIDVDAETGLSQGDEATVTLRDAVSGETVDADLDAGTDGDNHYEGTEVIDGQTYHMNLSTQGTTDSSDNRVVVTWGDNAGESDPGDQRALYPALDTRSGSAIAFNQHNIAEVNDRSGSNNLERYTFELPTTESTDEATVSLTQDDNGSILSNVTTNSQASSTSVWTSPTYGDAINVTVNGGAKWILHNNTAGGGGAFDLGAHQGADGRGAPDLITAGATVIQPEDDNDEEQAYLEFPSVDTGDEEVDVENAIYTGSTQQTATLESDDDVTAGYDFFGAASWYDSDGQGEFTLNLPNGQATAGAAITGMEGSLSSSGSAGSVTTQTPAGWPDVGALDSDSNIGQLKQNRNLILVGGPVVNSLVQELANADKTWGASQYSQGQAIVQQIDDAFSQGNDALVVAGMSGSDTREAANFLADYEANQDRLAGEDQVTLTTAQSTQ